MLFLGEVDYGKQKGKLHDVVTEGVKPSRMMPVQVGVSLRA
jgi:hypothetical protein